MCGRSLHYILHITYQQILVYFQVNLKILKQSAFYEKRYLCNIICGFDIAQIFKYCMYNKFYCQNCQPLAIQQPPRNQIFYQIIPYAKDPPMRQMQTANKYIKIYNISQKSSPNVRDSTRILYRFVSAPPSFQSIRDPSGIKVFRKRSANISTKTFQYICYQSINIVAVQSSNVTILKFFSMKSYFNSNLNDIKIHLHSDYTLVIIETKKRSTINSQWKVADTAQLRYLKSFKQTQSLYYIHRNITMVLGNWLS
eukprot:TRINITY_DN3183_c1_g1_i1.p1 TRINITY_DN3183_c1_g1~~TRINITY_DN3183_c1_g1_i1.p1  ORF type:complete len:254 (+),score=-14.16 TRINITY_DN3183_c1_g1_i1:196-957(+)